MTIEQAREQVKTTADMSGNEIALALLIEQQEKRIEMLEKIVRLLADYVPEFVI